MALIEVTRKVKKITSIPSNIHPILTLRDQSNNPISNPIQSNPMERENLVSNLLQNLNKLICVDYSRKIFAQDAFETIIALTTRKLVGQDRYRRILLGQKSVGKTTLLDALLKISQDHFRNLVCVKITNSRLLCDDIGKLPLEYVLGPTWQIWWCFQKLYYRRGRLLSVLENALLANNIFIFGIIDEFNEVFKKINIAVECRNQKLNMFKLLF